MTELFVPSTNSLLQGNGREHKTKIHHSLELSGQFLASLTLKLQIVKYYILNCPKSILLYPGVYYSSPLFPWPCGKVFHCNATLKTLECLRKKSLPAVILSSGHRNCCFFGASELMVRSWRVVQPCRFGCASNSSDLWFLAVIDTFDTITIRCLKKTLQHHHVRCVE